MGKRKAESDGCDDHCRRPRATPRQSARLRAASGRTPEQAVQGDAPAATAPAAAAAAATAVSAAVANAPAPELTTAAAAAPVIHAPAPTAATAVSISAFSRLALVELQLIMRCCSQSTLIALAQCSRFTLAAASHRFVWQLLPPVQLHCHQPSALSTRHLSPLLRHADISVTWQLQSQSAVSAKEMEAVASRPGLRALTVLGDRVALDDSSAQMLADALRSQIGRGGALATLALRSHAIGALGGAALAAFVERSRALTSLDLTDCCGSANRSSDVDRRRAHILLAASFGSSGSLRTLRLNQWRVDQHVAAALAAALSTSRSLVDIELQECKMDAAAAIALAPGVQASPSLQRVVLNKNAFGDAGAVALAAAVAASRSLTELGVESCCFGDEGLAALAAALEQCASVRMLSLNMGFGACSAGVGALCRALCADGCALTALALRSCRLNDEGAGPLVNALRSNRSLTDLRMEACTFINRESLPTVGAALAAALQRRSSRLLQRLDLIEFGLGDSGAAVLAAALPHAGSLRELTLCSTGIGAVGAAALAAGIGGHRGLTTLSLYLNAIGHDGLVALTPALLSCAGLRSLDLGHCGLAASSGAVLAQLLQGGSLDSLLLEGNELCAAGATSLFAALHAASSLRRLHLSRCFIGPEGAAALTAAIVGGWNPAELDVGRTGMGEEAALALVAALAKNHRTQPRPLRLQSLSLASCFWSPAAAASVVRSVRCVPTLRSLDLSQTFPHTNGKAQAAVLEARGERLDIAIRLR